jgi:WD40 repeat protein/tRNA A-37 threonylcarbamoyl transferase component Bud32
MAEESKNISSREQRIDEAIAEYLEAVEAGQPFDQQAFLARHADVAAAVEAFLADRHRFAKFAGELQKDAHPSKKQEHIPPPHVPTPPPGLNQAASLAPQGKGDVGNGTEAATLAPGEAPARSPRVTVRYFGDYELLEEIARGGMGVVYKARQVSLNRLVAVKMILAGQLASATDVHRFRTEAEAAANLKHPNIIALHEVGQHEGQHYFSMDYVAGTSLAGKVRENPLPAKQAARYIAIIAKAIHFAHQHGTLHRDLKPSNVLVDAADQLHVTDFGLAKRIEADGKLTGNGQVLGTPGYMPPEQAAANRGPVGPVSDVYALGATLYELVTGRPPFQAATPLDTLLQVLEAEPVSPRLLNPKIDRDVETICLKCLQKEPGRRYPTALALADDLQRYLEGQPIHARPIGNLQRFGRWCRRNPLAAALTGAVVCSLLAGAGIAGYFAVQASAGEQKALDSARRASANEQEAKDHANRAKRESRRAKKQAERARKAGLLARRRLYISDMRLCQHAWNQARIDLLLELLEGQQPEHTGGKDLRGFEWYYWHRLCHAELRAFKGLSPGRWTVAFSPDGRQLAAARGGWEEVKIWDAVTGQELVVRKSDRGMVAAPPAAMPIAFAPDGKRLFWVRDTGDLTVWDAIAGKQIRSTGERANFHEVALSPNGQRLAAAFLPTSGKGPLRIWDVTGGRKPFTIKCPEVATLAFSPDGRRLATIDANRPDGSWYRMVRIWDVSTGRQLLALEAHTGLVMQWVFSPDGKRLASAGDRTIKVWDTDTGREQLALKGHTDDIWSVAFRPDGRLLASAGGDQTVRVWDALTGKEVLTLKHTSSVRSVAFSPDNRRLAAVAADGVAKIWDLTSDPESVAVRDPGHEGVMGVAFSPDGRHLASVGRWTKLKVWDAATGREVRTLSGHSTVAFSPDGRWLASGQSKLPGQQNGVTVWKAATGEKVREFKGYNGRKGSPISALAFSPDSRRLACGVPLRNNEVRIKIWDIARGREIFSLEDHIDVNCIAFSPDGKWLATASIDRTMKIWDLTHGREMHTLLAHDPSVNSVAFSPDSRRLASAGDDRTVKIWDVFTGRELLTIKGHRWGVKCVAFSRDGKRLASATGSADRADVPGEIKFWDAETGEETLTLKDPRQGITGLAFSPDGRRLLTGGLDGTLRIWDARPVTDKTPMEREAQSLYRFAVNRLGLKDEMAAHIRKDTSVTKKARQQALAWVKGYRVEAWRLDRASWVVVRLPGAAAAASRLALRQAETACGSHPVEPHYFTTLGAAHYRLGQYKEALAALLRVQELRGNDAKEHDELAFLAMTRHQLGQKEQAHAHLVQLRKRCKDMEGLDKEHPEAHEARALLREAEAVVEGKR